MYQVYHCTYSPGVVQWYSNSYLYYSVINYKKSIELNKAVYDQPISDVFSYVRNVLIVAGITWLLIDGEIYDSSVASRFFVLFLVLILVWVLYGTYRRITGYKLERFDTGLSREENKEFIRHYFREGEEYGVSVYDDNYLVGTRQEVDLFTPKMLSVLLFDGYVLLNGRGIDRYGQYYAPLMGLGYLKKELTASLKKYKELIQ